MRRFTFVSTLGLAVFVAGVNAAAPEETAPEAKAYVNFTFGGESAKTQGIHYGLRIDHDSRLPGAQDRPAVMQLDFGPNGRLQASLNGVSLRNRTYRLNQAEETVEETETGFFEGIWDGVTGFFGNLFGVGEDEEATESVYEEAAPAEAAEEGTFLGYNAADWALLAVGAAGLGFAGSEVIDGEDSPDVEDPGSSSGNGGNGGGCGLPICPPLAGNPAAGYESRLAPDYREWLDGDTGQMGDLHPAR